MGVGIRIGVQKIMDGATTTGAQTAVRPNGAKQTFQAMGTTSSGAGASVVTIQVSNDNVDWVTLGAITLTLATTSSSDGFASNAPWEYARAYVTSISGTGAAVTAYMGVEV